MKVPSWIFALGVAALSMGTAAPAEFAEKQATSRSDSSAAAAPEVDGLQVWLLRADGTHVQPVRRWETPEAVAMRYGDAFMIEGLPSLGQ